jgi:signal transduction histidine kinase/CheY-like chemotaxis protein
LLTIVILGCCGWLLAVGLPQAQALLRGRETQYVERFIADVVDVSRNRSIDNDWYESQQGRFDHLGYESGAFFAADHSGLLVHGSGDFSAGNLQDKLDMVGVNDLLKSVMAGTGIRHYEVSHADVQQVMFVGRVENTLICVLIPQAKLYAAADIATRSISLMVGLGLLLFLLLTYEYKQRLKSRYDKIQKAVKAIAYGNYGIEVKVPRGSLRRLMASINALAEKMREKEALEEQLVRSQKMEVVGTLASGIAHDFNNVLGGISGALDLIKGECAAGDNNADLEMIEQMSEVAVDCVKRGRDTVDRLLSFSRKSEKQREVVDLNAVIASIKKICTHSFDKRIEVRLEPWGGLATVSGNRSDLEQAVLNLCINARDAMDGTGQLAIKVERVAEQDLPQKRAKAAGPHFCLSLKDTGCGMDPATIDQVFEPFFTTKEKGKGTGLGLAMVYRIVEDGNGWIDVASEKNVGTTFSLYFPCEAADETMSMSAEVAAELEAERKQAEEADAAESETILVIEDDAILRELTAEYLQRSGYQALTAPDGQLGIEMFNERLESIDGVILDLILPTVSGEIVFERMKQLDPDVRVLLTSGSSNDKLITHLLTTGCRGFLPKPYSLEELTAAVSNHLLPAGRRR